MFKWADSPDLKIEVLIIDETMRHVTARDRLTFWPHTSDP
jgi:hypothetical protein